MDTHPRYVQVTVQQVTAEQVSGWCFTLKILKRRSGGTEFGELVSTTHNAYVKDSSVPQLDFHQSDKSKVFFPFLSLFSSNDLMEK